MILISSRHQLTVIERSVGRPAIEIGLHLLLHIKLQKTLIVYLILIVILSPDRVQPEVIGKTATK